jgi:hypothetical protein
VLLVQPGGFRTQMIPNSELKSVNMVRPAYVQYHSLCAEALKCVDGSQPGDPHKASNVIADVVRDEGCAIGKKWPNVLYLGQDAEHDIRLKCQQVLERLDDAEWRDVGRGVSV